MGLLDNPLAMSMFASGPGLNSNGLSRNLMQMRALRYMHEPTPRPMHMGQGGGNPLLGMMGGGGADYSQFTFDPAARAAADNMLSPYGLHPLSPDQVNPNALLPNSGFFGRHQRLASALEGGIFGGAMTRGADTWGEGISNVLQGMIAGPQARHALWERQFAAPFSAADTLEGLADKQQKRQLTEADIQWRRAEAQKAQNPMPDKFQGQWDEDDGSRWTWDAAAQKRVQIAPPGSISKPDKGASNPLGSGLEAQIIAGQLGPMPSDPKQKAAYFKKAEAAYKRLAFQKSENNAAGGEAGRKPTKDKEKADKEATWKAEQRNKYILDAKTADYFNAGIEPGKPDSKAKLAAYFDKNVAPLLKMPTDAEDENSPMPQGNAPKVLKFNPNSGKLE